MTERMFRNVIGRGKIMFGCLNMLLCVLLLWSSVSTVSCVLNVYPKMKQISIKGEPGDPLFLTPLIEAGKIEEAQKAARVGTLEGAGNVTSFSGYFTVNKKFDSNLFFWFFPAESNYPSAPVVLWLQGGPGATSLFGLFTENGPFSVNNKLYLKRREFSWTKTHSVIYIDNPVGTGYSFTNSDDGYARNETIIGEDLYNALLQFFKLFPELQKSEFYVTGESYAGKYVPAVSYTIHTRNPGAKQHINLKGLAIGNGLCDPEHMLKYGDYLYQLGLIDLNAREVFHEMESLGIKYIQEKKWSEAFDVIGKLVLADSHTGSLFYNLSGFTSHYNYLHDKEEDTDAMGTYIQLAKVRKAIHVGKLTFHTDSKVEEKLQQDFMQSVKPWVEILLEDYRVLIYNGQLDIIVAYPLTLGFLQALEWSGAAAYKTASRFQWHVGNDLAGYVKSVGHLTEVLVRDAGHMVPSDQSKWAFDLINRFTADKPFHSF